MQTSTRVGRPALTEQPPGSREIIGEHNDENSGSYADRDATAYNRGAFETKDRVAAYGRQYRPRRRSMELLWRRKDATLEGDYGRVVFACAAGWAMAA